MPRALSAPEGVKSFKLSICRKIDKVILVNDFGENAGIIRGRFVPKELVPPTAREAGTTNRAGPMSALASLSFRKEKSLARRLHGGGHFLQSYFARFLISCNPTLQDLPQTICNPRASTLNPSHPQRQTPSPVARASDNRPRCSGPPHRSPGFPRRPQRPDSRPRACCRPCLPQARTSGQTHARVCAAGT